MKIERVNADSRRLSSLENGEVFEYQTNLWLKTNEVIDGTITCVRLEDGHIDWFVEKCFVYKRDAKVVIE